LFGSYPLCYMHEWIPEKELVKLFRTRKTKEKKMTEERRHDFHLASG